MSRYEWESGKIILPAKAAYPFKKQLTEYLNNEIDRMFTVSQEAFANISSKFKEHRNVDFRKGFRREIVNLLKRSYSQDCAFELYLEYFGDLDKLFFKSDPTRLTPVKPTRTLFAQKIILNKPFFYKSRHGNFSIEIKERVLHWQVPENHLAVQFAREHPVAIEVFELLRNVKWTLRSGGKIFGNDEYNRAFHYIPSGANYVNESFGS